MRKDLFTALLVAVFLGVSANAIADDHAEGVGEEGANVLAVFVGDTRERREDGFSIAFEYSRLISETWSVGAFVEHTGGELDFWVVGLPIITRVDRWHFLAAPGIEHVEATSENEALIRLAVGYELFRGEKFAIEPVFAIDFVSSGQAYILGFATGFRF